LGDRFVKVLSLVFAAREDLCDGGLREAALAQALVDRPD